jgi:hypothetical protein
MTDLNVTITNTKTGEIEDRFSVHKGTAHSMICLLNQVQDSIRSNLDLDDYVHVPKKGHAINWEIVSPFVSRLNISGGWIYKVDNDKILYVPYPDPGSGSGNRI